jgi:chaperone modulatory protein CbpM
MTVTPKSQSRKTVAPITSLARRQVLDLETFARAASVHPDLARRLVALGLVEAYVGADGELRFARDQVAVVARLQRLRSGLALNYAAVGLVAELLDRIAELERASQSQQRNGGPPWT